jgi:hypothetical protein
MALPSLVARPYFWVASASNQVRSKRYSDEFTSTIDSIEFAGNRRDETVPHGRAQHDPLLIERM